jgi:hypothetical protein
MGRDARMRRSVADVENTLPAGSHGSKGMVFPLAMVKKFIRLIHFTVYSLSAEKDAIYITSDEPDPGFIEYFYPGTAITPVGSVFAWSLWRYARHYSTAIISMHPILARYFSGGVFTVPWIRQEISLNTPFEELFTDRERKREQKKALAFQYETSKDPADLQVFYDTMYLPFLRTRHQHPTILEFDYLLNNYLKNNGEILLIKKDGQVIAGGLCNLAGETYFLGTLGLKDESSVSEGAIAALYYYGIQLAYERGAKFVDLGLSRPFLSDGVVIYKRKWGGSIRRDDKNNHVLYLKNIIKNGLIVLEQDKLRAVVAGDEVFFSRTYPDEGIERSEHSQ